MVHHQDRDHRGLQVPGLHPLPTLERKPFSAAFWTLYNLQQTRLQLAPYPSFHPATTLTAAHCYTSLPVRPGLESTSVQRGLFDESLHQTTRPIDPGFLLSHTVRSAPAPPTCTSSAPARRAQSRPKPRLSSRTDQTQNSRVNPPCALALSQLELKSPIFRATRFSEGPLFLPQLARGLHHALSAPPRNLHSPDPPRFSHISTVSFLPPKQSASTPCHREPASPAKLIKLGATSRWGSTGPGAPTNQRRIRHYAHTRHGDIGTLRTKYPRPRPATSDQQPATSDQQPATCGTHPHTSQRRHASLAAKRPSEHPLWRFPDRLLHAGNTR